MYRSASSRDLFAQLQRLQRDLTQSFDGISPSIRGIPEGFPALNVGSTPEGIEIYAFAPGVDPRTIDVEVERGIVTIQGERAPEEGDGKATVHVAERFQGRFRRVVSLPEDVDPTGVRARYRDGVLQVSIPRRDSSRPRRIEVT